jgi:hypothetical protein
VLTNPLPVETHISVRETARRIGVKVATLRTWRCKGRGPHGYVKLSSTHGVYRESSVAAWMKENGLLATAEPVPKVAVGAPKSQTVSGDSEVL